MTRSRQIVVSAVLVALGAGIVGRSAAQAPNEPLTALARQALSQISGEITIAGLREPVEVIRDRWGVPHIYARTTEDLFFAQGYVVAQDRLWQMEMWRRQREGRLAEILGPSAVARDRTARMLKYRGPMDDREWTSYHPDGKRIFTAFAAGVNALIADRAKNLPIEFTLTGITPEPWTAETVVLRSATFGDASNELTLARAVARLGAAEANKQRAPDPFEALTVPTGLDVSTIDANVSTGRSGGGAIRPAIVERYRGLIGKAALDHDDPSAVREPGSNNWVVSGAMSATGKPVVANDPHREVGNPSLRYIVHLVAPGWNVIGAVEAPFVGIAIGHNDRLGWGLTIAGNDQEDVYVEETNPAHPEQVRWQSGWEPLRVVREEIRVLGQPAQTVELKFSRHGPVFHEDRARHRAYALRSALLEPGTAAYVAGLRLSQARNCREFLDAAMFWKAPTENLICGDVDGTISWQASALTPKRGPTGTTWSGRLPVPGSGAYEWDGFRRDLPRVINPPRGFIATANNNTHPPGFTPPVFFKTSTNREFDRITRLLQMIQPGRKFALDDHRRMQLDAVSLRARAEIPLFTGWTASAPDVERARNMIASWDGVLARDSAAAAVYAAWRTASTVPERSESRPAAERRPQHEASLARALQELTRTQGADWSAWRWGRMHTRAFPHPFVAAFDLPTIERPGGAGAVAADGASYREILDVADWDRSLVTNVPGQSAQPESPFYRNLLPLWAEDTYFPLVYSRPRVDREAAHTLRLVPGTPARRNAARGPSARVSAKSLQIRN